MMQAKMEKINTMKEFPSKAKPKELNDSNRLDIKIHLLEQRERMANNRYQNLLV